MSSNLDYPPERTALLVVDPYNHFLCEGDKLFGYCRETLTALDTVERVTVEVNGPSYASAIASTETLVSRFLTAA